MPVAPIAGHPLLIFLLQISLLLAMALATGRLAVRLGLPAVVGELFVGILLGPSLLGNLAPRLEHWLFPASGEQFHLLDAVGQIGMLLLVGITGMQVNMATVRRRARAAAGVSAFGLVVPLGLGIAIGFPLAGALTPDGTEPAVFALFLGVAMCVSAIPVIAKILMDMRLVHRNVGQLILTAGMVDDAFGWIMLSVVSALATAGLRTGTVLVSIAALLGVVAFAVLVGRPLAGAGLRLAARSPDSGPLITAAAAIILLGAAANQALGLEAVFGAFVCGVLVGSASGVDRNRFAPLRTVVVSTVAPIFFATAGLRMDLTALAAPRVLLAGLVVLACAFAGKFAGAYAGARLSRLGHWEGLALGAGLNARGVIELVVAMTGLRLGILNVEAFTIVVLVAVVTSLVAPPMLRYTMTRVQQTAEEEMRMSEDTAVAPR
jgi:Kef-type K+ transport system membrane component KefB